MPAIRLVAIDLDGTLLNTKSEIPSANRQALLEAHSIGVNVAIATGRRLPGITRYMESLGFDPLLIVNGGALVKEGLHGAILERRFLPRSVAERVVLVGQQQGMVPMVHDGPEGEGHLIVLSQDSFEPSLQRYLQQTQPPPIFVNDFALQRDPSQITFAGSVEKVRSFEEMLHRELFGQTSLERTEYIMKDLCLLDVLAKGVTKSTGLMFLRHHLKLTRQETMAIGDNWNDLNMLQEAGLGVVMENASSELKQLGFLLTGTNDAEGVAQAIRKYVLD